MTRTYLIKWIDIYLNVIKPKQYHSKAMNCCAAKKCTKPHQKDTHIHLHVRWVQHNACPPRSDYMYRRFSASLEILSSTAQLLWGFPSENTLYKPWLNEVRCEPQAREHGFLLPFKPHTSHNHLKPHTSHNHLKPHTTHNHFPLNHLRRRSTPLADRRTTFEETTFEGLRSVQSCCQADRCWFDGVWLKRMGGFTEGVGWALSGSS